MTLSTDFKKRMGELEALLTEIERGGDPVMKSRAREVVELLLEFHGAGLARILEMLGRAGGAGAEVVGELAGDELVSSLLVLHGLHPADLEERVREGLEKARPLLKSHSGDVELVGIEEGRVRLAMKGSCQGCPSSAATLKQTIEQAIYERAPEVAGIEVAGLEEKVERGTVSGVVSLTAKGVRLSA